MEAVCSSHGELQQTVEQQLLPVLDEHLHLQHLGGPLAPLHLAGPAHKLVYLDGWLVLQELLPDLDEHHLHLHLLGHLAPHLVGPAHKLVFYLDDWWLVLQKYSGSGLGYKDNHHLQDDTQEDCLEELYWRKILLGMQDFSLLNSLNVLLSLFHFVSK